jgi:16S rRNA processing protein RimM
MVVMGRVSVPHGIKGWIKVQPFTEDIDGLLGYPEWWLGRDGAWVQHRVAEVAVHGAAVLARLEGFSDRQAAMAFKGAQVGIPRDRLPASREGEYYWSDLLGMEVLNGRGEQLGRVVKLLETGANQVLVLGGEREALIPFIENVIVSVDLANKRIVADWNLDY